MPRHSVLHVAIAPAAVPRWRAIAHTVVLLRCCALPCEILDLRGFENLGGLGEQDAGLIFYSAALE